MRLIQDNGIYRLQFPELSALPGFFHGVFLREVSNGQSTEMFNLGMADGTPADLAQSNRRRMLATFGKGLDSVYARQVHGRQIGVLRSDARPGPLATSESFQLDGDALITDAEGAALVILVADCQPVLIIDPVKRVVANVHSGWRGSIQNIIGSTIRRMGDDFGCRPEDLMCAIGPSLGPCCAEFIHYADELPDSFWKYRDEKLRFDFWQASRDQMASAGVRADHISTSGFCTRCNPHLFFSYRGEKRTGRFAAVVGIEPAEGRER